MSSPTVSCERESNRARRSRSSRQQRCARNQCSMTHRLVRRMRLRRPRQLPSVGTPSAAVKLPSEPPPVAASRRVRSLFLTFCGAPVCRATVPVLFHRRTTIPPVMAAQAGSREGRNSLSTRAVALPSAEHTSTSAQFPCRDDVRSAAATTLSTSQGRSVKFSTFAAAARVPESPSARARSPPLCAATPVTSKLQSPTPCALSYRHDPRPFRAPATADEFSASQPVMGFIDRRIDLRLRCSAAVYIRRRSPFVVAARSRPLKSHQDSQLFMSSTPGPKIFPSASRQGIVASVPMGQTVSRCPSRSVLMFPESSGPKRSSSTSPYLA